MQFDITTLIIILSLVLIFLKMIVPHLINFIDEHYNSKKDNKAKKVKTKKK